MTYVCTHQWFAAIVPEREPGQLTLKCDSCGHEWDPIKDEREACARLVEARIIWATKDRAVDHLLDQNCLLRDIAEDIREREPNACGANPPG